MRHKTYINFIYVFKSTHHMVSRQISVGIGIPMIVVGALVAFLLAPIQIDIKETIEFVGSLIGILGVVIFIAGLFAQKTPQITT